MFEDRPQAKVNLTLEVVGRRPDGYHELRSIFLRVGLSDHLSLSPGGADGADSLTITGLPGASQRHNLVTRALDAVRTRAEIPLPTLDVRLDKQIPAAAGLGGGSSDAASAVKLAQACWGVGLSKDEELALGLELGSDVPFFLYGATAALVEGRGERVKALAEPTHAGLLLVTPALEVSTARVFDRYDDLASEARPRQIDEIDLVDLPSMGDRLRDANDLWAATSALEPSLAGLRDQLETASGVPWLMSGSGSTMFALYSSVVDASEAGKALVARRLPSIEKAQINAVDMVGPDPAWRYP
jgi:4-diphosphocytidyl-2-C-methyl-D-erythritol kinase